MKIRIHKRESENPEKNRESTNANQNIQYRSSESEKSNLDFDSIGVVESKKIIRSKNSEPWAKDGMLPKKSENAHNTTTNSPRRLELTRQVFNLQLLMKQIAVLT